MDTKSTRELLRFLQTRSIILNNHKTTAHILSRELMIRENEDPDISDIQLKTAKLYNKYINFLDILKKLEDHKLLFHKLTENLMDVITLSKNGAYIYTMLANSTSVTDLENTFLEFVILLNNFQESYLTLDYNTFIRLSNKLMEIIKAFKYTKIYVRVSADEDKWIYLYKFAIS